MRVLITGGAGFAAPHAARAFAEVGADVVGSTRDGSPAPGFDAMVTLDLADEATIRDAIDTVRPTHVLHLAGVAAPQAANAAPDFAWQVNTLGTIALGRALLATAPDTILLNAGSAAAYGSSAMRLERLDEDAAFAPTDEYGATKAAADLGLGALAKRGLRVVRLRPFNHTGPGQTKDYAAAAFAAQIAAIEQGRGEPVLKVGNLDAERDFSDVGEIAQAYAKVAIAASEGRIEPGRAYNLCAGRGVAMREILDILLSLSSARIEVRQDSDRMRPSDNPRIVGDPRRAEVELGWRAKRPIEETLRDTLSSWREALSN